jgi:hypothetical protein
MPEHRLQRARAEYPTYQDVEMDPAYAKGYDMNRIARVRQELSELPSTVQRFRVFEILSRHFPEDPRV